MEQEIEQTTEVAPFDVNDFFRPSIWQDKLARGRVHYQTVKHGMQNLLGSAMVKLTGNEDFLESDLAHEDDVPVSLGQLLRDLPTLPEMSALLGVAEDGAPLLVDLRAPESAHILIAGAAGAGKTMLLRSLLLSLASRQRQALVQMVLLDGSNRPELAPLAALPHALGPVVSELEDVAETLTFLVNEMGYRQEQGVKTPALVVAIDEIENLLEAGGQPVVAAIMRLLQKGAPAGIHLVLTSAAPAAPLLDNVFKAAIPLRIVGHLPDAGAARAAAGIGHSQAEYLQGQGDFVAIAGEMITAFQAAYVGDRNSKRLIQHLRRDSGGKLLAFPIDPVTGQLLEPEQPAATMAEVPDSRAEAADEAVADGADESILHLADSPWVDAVSDDAFWEDEDLEDDEGAPDQMAEWESDRFADEGDGSEDDDEDSQPVQARSLLSPRVVSRPNWSALAKSPGSLPNNQSAASDDDVEAEEEMVADDDDLNELVVDENVIELEYEDDEDYGTALADEDDEIPFE